MKMGTVIGKEWYKFREIATIEGLSYSMVRYLFVREPGVVPWGKLGSKRPTYRVPAGVYARVKLRLSNPPKTPKR